MRKDMYFQNYKAFHILHPSKSRLQVKKELNKYNSFLQEIMGWLQYNWRIFPITASVE